MSFNKMMDSFMDTYGVERTDITAMDCANAYDLIDDELTEFEEEFRESCFGYLLNDGVIDQANVAKEMADIIYVTAQRMRRMGMDVDAIMEEVHRSNMSKRVASDRIDTELNIARHRYPNAIAVKVDGGCHVIRDPDTGKVVKPECYSPAELVEGVHYGA
ncbi:MAG: hypothetical protein ACRC91_02415 [Aeromonas sp.]